MPLFFSLAQYTQRNTMLKLFTVGQKARKAFILVVVGGSLGLGVLFAYKAYSARIELLESTVQTQQEHIIQLDKRLATVHALATLAQTKGNELHNTIREVERNTQQSISSLAQIRKQDHEENTNPTMYVPMPDSFTSVLKQAEERARATTHN